MQNGHVARRLEIFLLATSTLLPAIALVGWAIKNLLLASFNQKSIPMAPLTAIVLLLFSFQLWSFCFFDDFFRRFWIFVSGVAIVACAGTFFLRVLQWYENLESLPSLGFAFLNSNLAIGGMSALAAASIFFLAISCIGLFRSVYETKYSGVTSLLSLSICGTCLLGYIYGTPILYGGSALPMALSTSLTLFSLNLLVLLVLPIEVFPKSLLCGDTVEAVLIRSVLPYALLAVIIPGFAFALLSRASEINLAFLAAVTAVFSVVWLSLAIIKTAQQFSKKLSDFHNLEILLEVTDKKFQETQVEKELAQARLRANYKMTALGEMAGGIAHEVNNPVSIILGKVRQIKELLKDTPVDTYSVNSFATAIDETARRILSIVYGLRIISRQAQQDMFTYESLMSIVESSLAISIGTFQEKGIRVILEGISKDEMLECQPAQVSQVLLNLLNNAVDAIEELEDRWVRIEVVKHSDCYKVTVINSGPQITADVRQKIFDPFFTTKEVGKGTGLGLNISANIAVAHGGMLECDGSADSPTFVLTLPLCQPRARSL